MVCMDDPADVLAQVHAVAHGRHPRCGTRLRSGEAVLCFSRLTHQALECGWTRRDIALASSLPVECIAALAEGHMTG